MAEFSIGEKCVRLLATESGYLVSKSTTRNIWANKSFGMKVEDYRQALDLFSAIVRTWLNDYA